MTAAERGWSLGEIFVLRHAGFPFDWLESLGMAAPARAAIAAAHAAPADAALRATAAAAFAAERARLAHRLHELATDAGVQEAVFLSSPDMFENVWTRYVAAPPPGASTSASRRIERRVYAYLQRLCAKNETTSFFGPLGYGEIAGDDDAIAFAPAPVRRETHLAYWAVEALASRAALEPELWRELPLRRNPLFTLDEAAGEVRCDAIAATVPLAAPQLALLRATAELADPEALAAALGLPRAALEALALPLCEAGVLVRRLWVRSDVADALGELRAALRALPASPARERWLAALAELDELRARFAVAPLAGRRELLPALEARFTALAEAPARRAGGRLYTDRLLLNEQASSPFQLRLGVRAARRLAAELSPLLEVAAAYGEQHQERCADAVAARLAGAGTLAFPAYAAALRDLRVGLPPVAPVPGGHGVAQLPPAWCGASRAGARFALPDLCLARGADGAIRVGLARMHHHLLTRGWLTALHPAPARCDVLAARWLARERRPLVELSTGRHNKGYYAFPGPRLAYAPAEMLPRGHRVLAAADATVALADGKPSLRGPDGAPLTLYLSLADLALHAPFTALVHAPVIKPELPAAGEATPRLAIGDAVLQRASWQLELRGLAADAELDRFAYLQAEKARLGLPRFVFARVPSERKPFLVDLDCPFACELLRGHARDDAAARLEEMWPPPAELWLRDARGRYTFELRAQAERITGE